MRKSQKSGLQQIRHNPTGTPASFNDNTHNVVRSEVNNGYLKQIILPNFFLCNSPQLVNYTIINCFIGQFRLKLTSAKRH